MRTDDEVIAQTNRLAREFYRRQGYAVPEDYQFQEASHPQEIMCWDMACTAQIELTDTDPNEAL